LRPQQITRYLTGRDGLTSAQARAVRLGTVEIDIDQDSPRHAYEQVADALREQILAGKIGPRLPSIMQLTESTGLSRVTIINALTVLEQEGLIFTRRGRGTFVMPEDERPKP